ncbi:unnamed protein product, partial [marine sediment metagenome]
PHGEQCDQALEHYEEVSKTASSWSSLIPQAIEFYKKHYVPYGERKIIDTANNELSVLEEALEEGWVFDPWLNPSGRPISIGLQNSDEAVYWVLVKGTPEQIAEMDPIAELPELEEEPETVASYGLNTLYIAHDAVDEDGDPVKPPEDYVIMHKDHIYAKGTVYTKLPKNALNA